MPWVLKKTDGKGAAVYVAPPGSKYSYCQKHKARQFRTRDEAEQDACGNEIAIEIH